MLPARDRARRNYRQRGRWRETFTLVASRSGNEKGNWKAVAALFTSLLTGCLGFLLCPQPAKCLGLTVAILKNNTREADVTEQIVVDARMLPAVESSLEQLDKRCHGVLP